MNNIPNPSSEFAPGHIVFLKADPSIRGAVVAVFPSTPESRINVFADGRIQSFRASQLQVSTTSDILSRIINAQPETIERIETSLQSPKKKSSNWEADRLFSEHFAQPIRFITYTGIKDLSNVGTKPYVLWGVDANGERVHLTKLQILFAFPKEKMPDLKPHVKIRPPLKAQKLQPVEDPKERFHIDNQLLQYAQRDKSNVNIVTRTGHVLNGWIQHFDKYVLYMRIGGKVVVVYRHGLFELTVAEESDISDQKT